MKLRLLVLFLVMLSSSTLLAQDEAPHWTYEGEEGPDRWGELGESYATCATGHEQSPIDITSVEVEHLPNIEFHYAESALHIVNNGHTIQAKYDTGSSIAINGVGHDLLQFHFHTPSEHTIAGESFPMELHLVHGSADRVTAVVGLLLQVGDSDNDALAPVLANMPAEASHDNTAITIDGVTINALNFLPADQQYFAYAGSLTTPPCTEHVQWHVLTTPISISQAQFDAYTALYAMNARPLQPIFERNVALDFGS